MRKKRYGENIFVLGVVGFVLSGTAVRAAEVNGDNALWSQITEHTSYKFNMLLQGWTLSHEKSTTQDQNFRLRRAELKLSGALAGVTKYFFMMDPARLIPPPHGASVSAENMVQDFGLSYSLIPGLEFTVGQYKVPTMAESLDSSYDLPLPERSLVARVLGYRREMGAKVSYKTYYGSLTSMVSSGRALYGTGQGMLHELNTRIEVTPLQNLSVGSFVTLGNDFDYSSKGRWGMNARYRLKAWSVRGEYAQAKDGAVHSSGLTAEIGCRLMESLESVLRYEMFSPNHSFSYHGQAETLGVSYLLKKYYTKLQLAGSILQNMAAGTGSPLVAAGVQSRELTFAVQTGI